MVATQAAIARGNGTNDTDDGSSSRQPASLWTQDREAWRDGYDRGLGHGATRILAAPLMENLALEVTLLRAAVEAMAQVAHEQEKKLVWYERKLLEAYRHITGSA